MTVTGQHVENDQVVRLVKTYREKGDRRAVERIFAMHGRILHHIVRRYSNSSGEPHEDLLQVGYVGLIKAVNGYKMDSKAKFSSYAYSMIDGELRHHFRDTAMVKKPRWARSLYSRISASTTRLSGKLGRPPLIEEIAWDVNVTPEGVVEVMKLFLDTNVSSLDAPGTGSDGNEVPNLAVKNLEYESFSMPIEDRILLEQGLESLSELQQRVVYLFFYKDLSQTEIGERLGLPQRKVSRIIASATKSLKEKLSQLR
ncbi:MAG: sigma-70 family RNA polymerase sigma factor [Rubrobacter sp.]|nr:sigma-70 family RNA polymerase sigma factor [Rubrobacter sp.]MDQ3638923.1 sigma-70 family RNA polymerase sigma factor [Actinomycetota bacterium]